MNNLIIKKPNIAELKRKGYNLIDMHVHTNASHDGKAIISSIIKKAKRLGIGIAITDHNKIDSTITALENNNNILIIPGIEVFAKNERHVLFYFYNKKELIRFYNNEVKNKFLEYTAEELLNRKDRYACIAGIAHPKGYKLWHNFRVDYDTKKIDFIEVLNGSCSKSKALKSYKIAIKYKKPITAGSDAHILSKVGKCLTCSKGKTTKEILDSIKNKQTSAIGLTLSLKEKLEKAPGDSYHLFLWIMAKIYQYTGVKSWIKRRKSTN